MTGMSNGNLFLYVCFWNYNCQLLAPFPLPSLKFSSPKKITAGLLRREIKELHEKKKEKMQRIKKNNDAYMKHNRGLVYQELDKLYRRLGEETVRRQKEWHLHQVSLSAPTWAESISQSQSKKKQKSSNEMDSTSADDTLPLIACLRDDISQLERVVDDLEKRQENFSNSTVEWDGGNISHTAVICNEEDTLVDVIDNDDNDLESVASVGDVDNEFGIFERY